MLLIHTMSIKEFFQNLPIIETKRIILRQIAATDAQDLFEYACDEEMTKYVTWEKPKTVDDSKKFIDFQLSNYKHGKPAQWGIVDKENNKFIGTCGFHSFDERHKHAEIVYAVGRNYWGKGIMSEAIQTVLKYGFEKLDLNRIEATVMNDNIGSQKVLLKNGFSEEGHIREWILKNGKFHDLKLYGILKREFLAK